MGWEISLLGLLVGLLVGLTGVGGAALLTPLLVLIGINPSIAVGTDLFYNSITKLFGTVQHWRQRTVNKTLVRYLAYGSIPGAISAVLILKAFDSVFHSSESFTKHALGVVLIIASVATLVKPLLKLKEKKSGEVEEHVVADKKILTVTVGFVLGFIVGLTSIGSGSLFALAMLYLFRLKTSEIVGTDIAHAFLLVTVAGIMHASFGNVDFALAGRLLIGSVPGVLIGSVLSAKLPPTPLRTAMAGIILISGLKLI
ncbi:sulfite exporter TauE/SafE family protein [Gorillibacterium sp. sgz5001074]|uniref:sulfite exporter TauE/SafE family protein n=1 Tax=Gorillibacterium sp. sgz5001074 TaxID=3446695 RepID=UPI003F664292